MYRMEIIYYTDCMKENQLQKIHDQAREHHVPIMLDDGMEFLLEYIRIHEGIRDILEIGTAVGYSAIQMANLRWDMMIDTIEVDPEMYQQAKLNVMHAGLENRITLHLQDAYTFQTKKIYDLIFVDAAKSQYRKYMEHFFQNTRKGTVFFFDNLSFHGIVEHPNLSKNRSTLQMTRKIMKFREYLKNDTRLDTEFFLEVGDGIAISKVK